MEKEEEDNSKAVYSATNELCSVTNARTTYIANSLDYGPVRTNDDHHTAVIGNHHFSSPADQQSPSLLEDKSVRLKSSSNPPAELNSGPGLRKASVPRVSSSFSSGDGHVRGTSSVNKSRNRSRPAPVVTDEKMLSHEHTVSRSIPERVAQYYYSLGLFCSSHAFIVIFCAIIVVLFSW